MWKLPAEKSHDRVQLLLEKPSMFRKTTTLMSQYGLKPYNLHLRRGNLMALKLAVDVFPIVARGERN